MTRLHVALIRTKPALRSYPKNGPRLFDPLQNPRNVLWIDPEYDINVAGSDRRAVQDGCQCAHEDEINAVRARTPQRLEIILH